MSDRLKVILALASLSIVFLVLSLLIPSVSFSFTLSALVLIAYIIYLIILMLSDASWSWYPLSALICAGLSSGVANAHSSLALGFYLLTGVFSVLGLCFQMFGLDGLKP